MQFVYKNCCSIVMIVHTTVYIKSIYHFSTFFIQEIYSKTKQSIKTIKITLQGSHLHQLVALFLSNTILCAYKYEKYLKL